jgi:hypothetical protein
VTWNGINIGVLLPSFLCLFAGEEPLANPLHNRHRAEAAAASPLSLLSKQEHHEISTVAPTSPPPSNAAPVEWIGDGSALALLPTLRHPIAIAHSVTVTQPLLPPFTASAYPVSLIIPPVRHYAPPPVYPQLSDAHNASALREPLLHDS